MDNLGAIGGPLLALALVGSAFARRSCSRSSQACWRPWRSSDAIRHAPRLERHEREAIRLRLRPVMRGRLGRLMPAVGAFTAPRRSGVRVPLAPSKSLEISNSSTTAAAARPASFG
jgi:hypothetical protein